MSFTESEIAYLSGQHLGRLATLRADGTLQNSPVGFRYNQRTGTIDIAGQHMAGSRKFRNVAATGEVAFVIDDVPSIEPLQVRCLEIRGAAEALEEAADSGYGPDAPIIRIHPRRIVSFGLGEPDADARTPVVQARNV
ncbi:PPOX class F420-dependent oxidoreductase [Paractinoplanes lichenicola]|uniref:PPOX class F420-dependent oxidoreductase n=1 Tax=Paractinoplanes lichenicola TaxID=2802976 RepID=A0ABS1W4S5_9ACTN|nr:PPOX class F420-dependent oxidoreductase [Actinoplanes lichenicola]MBL7261558.1 PPOX class F420-dependent oxidoreductase [Actinoplanes lichenicola]